MSQPASRSSAKATPSRKADSKPELTDADKALLEAEPDWERMGQAAKRLLSGKPNQADAANALTGKPQGATKGG